MDLKNNMIPVREVLKNPKAKAILQRDFPKLLGSPMLNMAMNMPLKNVLNMVKGYIPQSTINALLEELKTV